MLSRPFIFQGCTNRNAGKERNNRKMQREGKQKYAGWGGRIDKCTGRGNVNISRRAVDCKLTNVWSGRGHNDNQKGV